MGGATPAKPEKLSFRGGSFVCLNSEIVFQALPSVYCPDQRAYSEPQSVQTSAVVI
jgi:hypothetical protein